MKKSIKHQNAANERWNPTIPKATHEGIIFIGNQSLECDVLPDGRRILRHKTFTTAMGRGKPGSKDVKSAESLNLPIFLTANNLTPYLGPEIEKSGKTIFYKSKDGRRMKGYEANLLPEACKVYAKADDENVLLLSQKNIAKVCRAMLYSLASVGIVALIDEATGYQEARALNELQTILDKYIAQELRPWTQKFPNEFFKQVYRLHGWSYPKIGKNHPQYIGKFINKYIYDALPPGILDELKKRNPISENGNRKFRHHQFLTQDLGEENLKLQINQIISYMKISDTVKDLDLYLDKSNR